MSIENNRTSSVFCRRSPAHGTRIGDRFTTKITFTHLLATNTGDACHVSLGLGRAGSTTTRNVSRDSVSTMELKPFINEHLRSFSKFHLYPNLQRRSSSARRLQHETEPDQPSTSFTTCMNVSLLPSDPALSS